MTVRFSEDVVPLTDLKVNPGRVIKHTTKARRPVLLTSRGRAVAAVRLLDSLLAVLAVTHGFRLRIH